MLLRIGALLIMVSYVSSVSSSMCVPFFAGRGVSGLLSLASAAIGLRVRAHEGIPPMVSSTRLRHPRAPCLSFLATGL